MLGKVKDRRKKTTEKQKCRDGLMEIQAKLHE